MSPPPVEPGYVNLMPGQALRLRGWKNDLFAERQRNTANKNALILYYIRDGTLR